MMHERRGHWGLGFLFLGEMWTPVSFLFPQRAETLVFLPGVLPAPGVPVPTAVYQGATWTPQGALPTLRHLLVLSQGP